MTALLKGRSFQLWEYRVSHGSLLIRSPAGLQHDSSVDIICVGVEYIAAPRHLGEISISHPADVEIVTLEAILGKELDLARVWALQGTHQRFLIVAAALKVGEHRGDIFDSPFDV